MLSPGPWSTTIVLAKIESGRYKGFTCNKIRTMSNEMGDCRQDNVLSQSDSQVASQMPVLTFCPVFRDSIFWPIKGFKNKELSFEKFAIVQQETILLKNHWYRG